MGVKLHRGFESRPLRSRVSLQTHGPGRRWTKSGRWLLGWQRPRADLVDRSGIIDEYDTSERLPGQQRRSLALRSEEEALDGDESGDIAHVAVELRDKDRVLLLESDGKASQAGIVAPGKRAEVCQRLYGLRGQGAVTAEVGGKGRLVG